MNERFNAKQLVFLNQYFKNPTLSINQVSKVTSISQITLKNYYTHFKEEGFLTGDFFKKDEILGMRVHSEAHAIIALKRLRLTKLFIYLEIQDKQATREMRQTLQMIPYLVKMWTVAIPNTAILLEFNLPITEVDWYRGVFDVMYELNLINNIDYYTCTTDSRSHLNFQKFIDQDKMEDIEPLKEAFSKFYLTKSKPENSRQESLNFDIVDLQLIRELQINANLALTTIDEYYDKDLSTLSRRVNSIRDSFITDYNVDFNVSELNFFHLVIMGKGSPRILSTLQAMIDKDVFWIETLYSKAHTDFVWQIKAPMNYLIEFQGFLNDILEIEHSLILAKEQYVNYLDPNNYDGEKKEWMPHQDVIHNIKERLALMLTNSLAETGKKIEKNIDENNLDIFSMLDSRFLDFIDFVEYVKKTKDVVLDRARIETLLKISTRADKHFCLALLYLYTNDVPQETVQYLERMITNVT